MLKPKITIYNNSVKLNIYDLPLERVLEGMVKEHTLVDTVCIGRGRYEKVVTGTFYWLSKDGKEARFNIHSLPTLLYMLKREGLSQNNITMVREEEYDAKKIKLKMKSNFKPKSYQGRYIDAISGESSKRAHLVDLQPGYGKASHEDTKVLTFDGWKLLKHIKVNDLVYNRYGNLVEVTGVHPQGKVMLYKVRFEDGRTHRCCMEHLWTIKDVDDYEAVVDTKSLLNNPERYSIPLQEPIKPFTMKKADFYLMGKTISIKNEIQIPSEHYLLNYLTNNQKLSLLKGIFGLKRENEINQPIRYRKEYPNRDFIKRLVWTMGGKVMEVDGKFEIDLTSKYLKIESVVKDKEANAICLSVKSEDKTFITEDNIVTHNTFIGVSAVIKNSMRTAIVVKAEYVEKWTNDICKYIDLKEEEYFTIQGRDSITTLNNMPKKELNNVKFIIISIRTFKFYIEEWEKDENSVPFPPYEFAKKFQIGTLLNDETHQEYEALFKISLFIDAKKYIGLSATMISGDKAKDSMYKLLFPMRYRASNLVEYKKYITMVAIDYIINGNLVHKTHRGYNHIKYEQSMTRKALIFSDYKQMMIDLVEEYYYSRREKGDKCILFFATVDLCTIMQKTLKGHFRSLDVRRYTGDDPLSNILTADITATTNKSAGTAVDIPNLITVVQTVPISSIQLNIQTAGRLREIEGKETMFISVHNNYKAHKKLKMKRGIALKDIVKKVIYTTYGKIVGSYGNKDRNGSKTKKSKASLYF